MTTTKTQQSSTSVTARLRDNQATRYLIAGIIILAVSVVNLVTVVANWTAGWSLDIVSGNALPFAGAAFGVVLVIGGIVKSRRN